MNTKDCAALIALAFGLFSCRPPEPSLGQRAAELSGAEYSKSAASPSTGASRPKAPGSETKKADEEAQSEQDQQKQVNAMLRRVAQARGLPIRRNIPLRILDRPAMLARIRQQVQEDLPADVLRHQGITMRAMGFVPPDYDYVAGTYRLIQGQIAGFYMPNDGMMYLAEDLSEAEAEETLAHELVHALQDQSFGLAPLIKYRPGDGDRISAVHAMVEGDATSAMLDISVGSAFAVSESALARLLSMSIALSDTGADTPRMIRESLTLPYSDGFRFVQALRRRGAFGAVDAAYGAPPESTEQLMHIEKYLAKEPALLVNVAPAQSLGEGFRAVFDDVMGEQGMKLALEEWVFRDLAKEAAAGWGGDRMTLYLKQDPKDADKSIYAVVWRIRMDSDADAKELSEVLKAKMPKGCIERAKVGPLAYKAEGRDAVIVAGPHEETPSGQVKESGGCEQTRNWAAMILKKGSR